jgi:hypothetical protein
MTAARSSGSSTVGVPPPKCRCESGIRAGSTSAIRSISSRADKARRVRSGRAVGAIRDRWLPENALKNVVRWDSWCIAVRWSLHIFRKRKASQTLLNRLGINFRSSESLVQFWNARPVLALSAEAAGRPSVFKRIRWGSDHPPMEDSMPASSCTRCTNPVQQ